MIGDKVNVGVCAVVDGGDSPASEQEVTRPEPKTTLELKEDSLFKTS